MSLPNNTQPCKLCGSPVEELRDYGGIYNYECSSSACDNHLYGDFEHHATGRKAWNTAQLRDDK